MLRTAVYSEKGGVGKTSVTNGLVAVAARRGLRVCAVDLDPRATLTDELGVVDPPLTLNDIMFVDPQSDDIPPDPAALVHDVLVPAGADWPESVRVIAGDRLMQNREMDTTSGMEYRLARALWGLRDVVDLVLMDVPPRAGGRVAGSALIAADVALIPATLARDGVLGTREALKSIAKVSAPGGTNDGLRVAGVVRSIVPRSRERSGVHDDREQELIEEFGAHLLPMQIKNYAVREIARGASMPITAATGREAKILVEVYDQILDHLLSLKAGA